MGLLDNMNPSTTERTNLDHFVYIGDNNAHKLYKFDSLTRSYSDVFNKSDKHGTLNDSLNKTA